MTTKLYEMVASPHQRSNTGSARRGEHHHAEDAGEDGRQAGAGVPDLAEVGDGPDADRELGQHRVDDVRPRHQHVAVEEVAQ